MCSFQDVLHPLEKWEDVLEISFGPDGLSVLVVEPPERPRLTCKGIELIRAVGTQHPIARAVLSMADNTHAALGDGTKLFVFMVLDMCRHLRLVGRAQVVMMLSRAEQNLLPGLFAQLDEMARKVTCQEIIQTLFVGFPGTVARVLSNLMCEYVEKWNPNSEQVSDLIQDWNCACLKGGGSVSDSKVLPGFLLDQKLVADPPQDISGSYFVVWKFNTSGWEHTRMQQVLKRHHQLGVRLIICCATFPAYFACLCRTLNVTAVSDIPHRTLDYIIRHAKVSPLYDAEEPDSSHLATLSSIQLLQQGILVNTGTIIQIRVCGPTPELCHQYSRACHDSLKVLRLWYDGDNKGVPGGGQSEAAMADFLASMAGDSFSLAPALAKSLQGIVQRLCKNSARSSLGVVEPLLLKQRILENVFDAVSFIFRVEQVCLVRKRINQKEFLPDDVNDD